LKKEDKFTYHYDGQFKRILTQFLAVFTCIKVASGKTNELEPRFIEVQVKHGSSDRVVAAIKAHQTQNGVVRLPMIAGHITNVDLDSSLMKGTRVERKSVKMPSGGVFPSDLKTYTQVMPVPYRVQFELNIFASNLDQHWEMLEQLLLWFDPTLELTTSDEVMNWGRISMLRLDSVNFDESIPGTERRFVQSTLNFSAPVYLSAPTEVSNDYINEIKMRVGAVNSLTPVEDALAQLDADGVEYDTIARLGDLELPSDPT